MQAPDIFNFLKVRGGSWFNPLGSGPAGPPQPRQHRAFAFRCRSSWTSQNRAGAGTPRHRGFRRPPSTAPACRRLQERPRRLRMQRSHLSAEISPNNREQQGKEQKTSQLPGSASRVWEDGAKGNIHLPVSAFQTDTWSLPRSGGLGKAHCTSF